MPRMNATATTALQQRFRCNVERILDEQGLRRADLARKLGVAQPRINEMLGGQQKIGLYVVDQVAAALDVDPLELLSELSNSVNLD